MSARFVNVDRDTHMMLPPSLQDWVNDDDMVHFVIHVVDSMKLPQVEVNRQAICVHPPQSLQWLKAGSVPVVPPLTLDQFLVPSPGEPLDHEDGNSHGTVQKSYSGTINARSRAGAKR